ncbi:ABC transporter substrate-binding protein [Paenibacillus sp. S150]|uniref:ABC transporter substrate-binding protein n=1 Tax=Paenibacillus sp. S150 TaxID=2749826 RepID=UPI001C58FEE6|nr:ABC transporter substrate-binding protein [Paenibacillus sp. S150]MBW4082705.1 ABC transporter substrate-binding protein [Paenibacillus sp. S150]
MTVVMVLMLLLTACGGGNNTAAVEGSTGNDSNAGSTADTSPMVLTIAIPADIQSFDVHNNNTTVSEAVLVNMYDYLLRNDVDGNKVPVLAESWEQVDDTTWRFKLRSDVKFHNGDPFTAADVKYTLERIATDSALKQNSLYKQIKAVNIIDDYTVDIITDGPDPIFLNRLSRMGSGMLPSKYIEEQGMEAFLAAPVGTGPYKFQKWAKDDRIELVRNDDYFGGTPKWDELVFRTIPEASTRVSELLTGGVDLISDVPSTDVERIEAAENTSIAITPVQRVLQLILRMTEGSVTADPKVREAIDLAIDKQAIVDSIAGGSGVVTRTSVTPGNFGADPSLYEQTLYDPDRAAALLTEAGYGEGEAALSLSVQSQYKEYAEVVSAMLTKVGFTVNLDVMEASAFSEKMSSKTFGEMFMIGIGNSLNDASNNYNRFLLDRAKGETDYNNPEVEALLQAALTNMNAEERTRQYQQVQQILAEERPAVYLFQVEAVYGVGSRIDYKPGKDEMFYAEEITPKN